LAIDSAGNIYIGDQDSLRVRKVSPAGIITTFVGGVSPDNQSGPNVGLHYPNAAATDLNGNVYFVDQLGQRVQRIAIDTGLVTTVVGTGVAGWGQENVVATTSEVSYPTGVAVDSHGNL